MGILYRIKTTIATRRRGVFILLIKVLAEKLIAGASLVTNLKVSGATFILNNNKLTQLTIDSLNHDKSATLEARLLEKSMRNDFRLDALCIEEAVNIAQDPTIATKMGFEEKSKKININNAELTVKNTSTIGQLKIKTKKVNKYHYYLIECTQLFSDGSDNIITEKSMSNPSGEVPGFISGALYLIRVRVVLTNNVKGKWTDYVLIRVS